MVVIGLIATFVSGGDDGAASPDDRTDEATSSPPTTLSTEDQIARSLRDFCGGDRAGVPDAAPYDAAPGRIHPIYGVDTHSTAVREGWSPNLEDLAQVELILCQDTIPGTEADGNRCDGYSSGVILQNVNAQWNVRLYAVQSGEVLAETTVTTGGEGCPTNVYYDPDSIEGGMVRQTRTPDWDSIRALVEAFVTP